MKCAHCSKELPNDNLKFCPFCGEKQTVPAAAPQSNPEAERRQFREQNAAPEYEHPQNPQQSSAFFEKDAQEFDFKRTINEVANSVEKKLDSESKYAKINLPRQIVPEVIQPCDSEKPIRQYRFMTMKLPLINYIAHGLLQVTNKRIVYSMFAKSRHGVDRDQSEFAIDDVAGVSVSCTTCFSFLSALIYILLCPVLFLVGGLLGGINEYLSVALGVAGIVVTLFLLKTKHYTLLHIFAAVLGDMCIMGTAGNFDILDMLFGFELEGAQIILLLLLLFFIVMNVISYGKSICRKNIAVNVTSKSGMTSPISFSQSGFMTVSHNLLASLCIIEPTSDTEKMARELGAMISDIQKMGDYGIEKWTE